MVRVNSLRHRLGVSPPEMIMGITIHWIWCDVCRKLQDKAHVWGTREYVCSGHQKERFERLKVNGGDPLPALVRRPA